MVKARQLKAINEAKWRSIIEQNRGFIDNVPHGSLLDGLFDANVDLGSPLAVAFKKELQPKLSGLSAKLKVAYKKAANLSIRNEIKGYRPQNNSSKVLRAPSMAEKAKTRSSASESASSENFCHNPVRKISDICEQRVPFNVAGIELYEKATTLNK